jgi:hypothetical protein
LSGTDPVSGRWGLDRGTPIDTYYIERFLAAHAHDIRGRVLEVGTDTYTIRFGGSAVTRSDVLHVGPGNPRATIVGDLATGDGIPEGLFDCLIVTNTLQLIFDLRGALATCARALKPAGVLLAHFPGITRNTVEWGPPGWNGAGDLWRLTSAAASQLCAERFGPEHVTIEAHGNVRVAAALLYGLAAEDLSGAELELRDPRYDVIVMARAIKPG